MKTEIAWCKLCCDERDNVNERDLDNDHDHDEIDDNHDQDKIDNDNDIMMETKVARGVSPPADWQHSY